MSKVSTCYNSSLLNLILLCGASGPVPNSPVSLTGGGTTLRINVLEDYVFASNTP